MSRRKELRGVSAQSISLSTLIKVKDSSDIQHFAENVKFNHNDPDNEHQT